MKTRSFQQSLLQQILALDQSSFPQFPCSHTSKQHHKSDICPSDLKYPITRSRLSKPKASSITDLEEDIIRIQNKQQKKTRAKYNHNQRDEENTRNIHKINKVKTEISQQHPPQMNYSTIYTRRSSLDESLYDKAMKEEGWKKVSISRNKQKQQVSELKPCSYKPSINETSRQIMDKVDKQKFYERMKKKRQDSFKKIIEETEKRQMKQCSFTPNIEKSQKNMVKSIKVESFIITQDTNRKSSQKKKPTIFDHLYQDSKTRQVKNKKMVQKYLKQLAKNPVIDNISKQITKNTTFEDRRLKYEKKKLQKELQMKEKQNIEKRSMHRPSINNTSHNRSKNMPIGQHLYLQSKKSKTIENKNVSNKNGCQQRMAVNKKSNQVYEQRKVLVFYQIFKMLDGDQDGAISINSINLDALPHQVVKIIYPLIQELEVMEVELQEHEFICSISNLFKTLSIHEKDILLGFIGNSQKQQDEQLFKPKINLKSKIIASYNERSQMSIYDYCTIKQAQKQKQLETERIQKSRRQIQKCTFQPKIITRYKY